MTIHQILFLDIETTRNPRTFAEMNEHGKAAFKKRFRKEIKALETEIIHVPVPGVPGMEYMQPLGEDGAAERVFRDNAPLFAEYGKIVCLTIGYIPALDKTGGVPKIKLKSWWLGDGKIDEEQMMREFADIAVKFDFICGHNLKEFDFPWLVRKMLVYNIRLPKLLNTYGKKPWELSIIDTSDLWKASSFKYYASLDQITYAMGIPSSKDGIVGAEVPEAFWLGRIYEIVHYCEKDVVATIRLALRMFRLMWIEMDANALPADVADENVIYTQLPNESIGETVSQGANNSAGEGNK
jgi:hypothetical protein